MDKQGTLTISSIMHPNMEFRGVNGKVVFSMKRKGEEYGTVYYIYELNRNNCTADELEKLITQFLPFYKDAAAVAGIPIYDIQNIMEQMKKQVAQDPIVLGDIKIKVVDQGTGQTNTLTVGITRKKVL